MLAVTFYWSMVCLNVSAALLAVASENLYPATRLDGVSLQVWWWRYWWRSGVLLGMLLYQMLEWSLAPCPAFTSCRNCGRFWRGLPRTLAAPGSTGLPKLKNPARSDGVYIPACSAGGVNLQIEIFYRRDGVVEV